MSDERLKDYARRILEKVAPCEIEQLEMMWDEFSADPESPLGGADQRDSGLAMGTGVEIRLVSLIVVPLVHHFGEALSQTPEEEVLDWVRTESMRGRLPPPDESQIQALVHAAREA